MFTFGSLFTGIGGLDLGLERSGMQCEWQVENDTFCQEVLQKHWPDVARYGDVRTVGQSNLSRVDLLCGGFPCQDVSSAGTKTGINGKQSGLWSEFYRIICELRPQYVLVENVSALLHRGIDRVLRDLAAGGYDAEWQCLPAAAFGAPHERDRIFILAYPNKSRWAPILRSFSEISIETHSAWPTNHMDTPGGYIQEMEERLREPALLRGYDGVPFGMERLGALGNAVVPQVAEYIGQMIMNNNPLQG